MLTDRPPVRDRSLARPLPLSPPLMSSTAAASSNGIFGGLRTHALAVAVLIWVSYLHLSGLYLFTSGFLLTRLALEDVSTCSPSSDSSCSLPATHSKAVVIIIDALRFDFISPNPPSPVSPHHHHVLTFPAEVSSSNPTRSLIFNAFSDPPTTTLQRLKGLTTGSLPTFIDAGSNFAGQAIAEDSWLLQLERAGKKVGFMGDNTWLSIFPDAFDANLTYPFDSFNVEDLHTVDEGVERHLLPLLSGADPTEWDILIGHFLGVDHVGHRLGPSHPTMQAKLEQMDDVLRRIVAELDDDTLLVVLGDHGMDQKGDHGGDGALETQSALWVYSKGPELSPQGSLVYPFPQWTTFPGSSRAHRSVQQIDLVPSLSLLLGLPIPFNNLGTVIPELFSTEDAFAAATKLNAKQIQRYLESYQHVSGSSKELERSMNTLRRAWNKVQALEKALEGSVVSKEAAAEVKAAAENRELEGGVGSKLKSLFGGKTVTKEASSTPFVATEAFSAELLTARHDFTRLALQQCRLLWAQFNFPLMSLGLFVLLLSLPTLWVVYSAIARERSRWEIWAQRNLGYAFWGGLCGGLFGVAFGALPNILRLDPSASTLSAVENGLFSSALGSQAAVLVPSFLPCIEAVGFFLRKSSSPFTILLGPILLAVHCIGLATNSFILWEDKITLYLLVTLTLFFVARAPAAPSSHLRLRLIGFSLLFAACIRLAGISTICREENMANCHVTFYEGASIPVSPLAFLFLSFPVAWFLPKLIEAFFDISKSYAGLAPVIVGQVWKWMLLGGCAYWLIDRGETWDQINPDRVPLIRSIKTWLARGVLGATLGAGYYLWYSSPLCIEVRRAGEGDDKDLETPDDGNPMRPAKPTKGQVIVLGFANSYGSAYLLFLLPFFALLWLVAQPTGQIVLALALVALLTFLEIVDSQRDSRALAEAFSSASNPEDFDPTAASASLAPSFTEVATLALLSFLLFYATGHQPVLSSIQWSTAFIGFPTLTYPFSPLLVGLNTWGPLLLVTLFVPLLGQWNVSPRPRAYVSVLPDSLKAVLGFMLYQAAVTVSTVVWAAWHRRHLMVWKVFAPRFMLAGVGLIVVDLGLILAVGVGMRVVAGKTLKTFGTLA